MQNLCYQQVEMFKNKKQEQKSALHKKGNVGPTDNWQVAFAH